MRIFFCGQHHDRDNHDCIGDDDGDNQDFFESHIRGRSEFNSLIELFTAVTSVAPTASKLLNGKECMRLAIDIPKKQGGSIRLFTDSSLETGNIVAIRTISLIPPRKPAPTLMRGYVASVWTRLGPWPSSLVDTCAYVRPAAEGWSCVQCVGRKLRAE